MEIHHTRDTLSVLDSDLSESRFSNANLAKSGFDDVNLQGATFANVNLAESRFSNAKLEKSGLDDVNLQGATFANVNLAEAMFADVDLRNASIADANLAGMRINGILVEELIRAHAARNGVVLYAKDLARVQAFYRAVVGLAVEHAEDDHVVLASPGFQLVVHTLPERIAASVDIENPPRRRTETPIKPIFPVASIAAARAIASQHGGELFPPGQEWELQAARVCDGVDPEGNVIQFREYPR